MMVNKTILLTGVSGLLGKELILPLVNRNYKVIGISAQKGHNIDEFYKEIVKMV